MKKNQSHKRNKSHKPTKNSNSGLPMSVSRRRAIMGLGASLTTWSLPSFAAFSTEESSTKPDLKNKPKIVWVLLRGAMDSLHTVVPTFEESLMDYRASLVEPIINDLLPLDDGFAFHPNLKGMHQLYKEKQLSPVIATATNYRARSHFDGQDALEAGQLPVHHESGWLNRALTQRHGVNRDYAGGLAVAQSMPISLRGEAEARTWYPDGLKNSKESLLERLQSLYEYDDLLADRLAEAMETEDMLGDVAARNSNPNTLVRACANLLKDEEGPDCAMIELSGWDTHKGQLGTLKNRLSVLDNAITILKSQLAEHWNNTVVIVATEFGRTVRVNGTMGTDHGTASNMFLSGGALTEGGKILGDWPGLKKADLYENRDLRPTTDVRHWIAMILSQHWDMDNAQIRAVFPDLVV